MSRCTHPEVDDLGRAASGRGSRRSWTSPSTAPSAKRIGTTVVDARELAQRVRPRRSRSRRSRRTSRRSRPAARRRCSAPTDALADAPNVAVRPTSASPITSADAVIAVRRGLRIALARASAPGGPKRRNGAPMARTAGRATAGSSITTPTSTPNAPNATTCTWSKMPLTSRARASPYDEQRAPRRPARPVRPRRDGRSRRPRGSGTSAIAATGGTRAARTAGIAAATTVTSDADDERHDDRAAEHHGRRLREVEPELAQQVEQTRPEQDARRPSPIADATAPTTNASSTTDRTT